MRVEVDPDSGFCPGVIRAIGRAEQCLEDGGPLYSLGSIVHNEEELSRLESAGLVTVEREDIDKIPSPAGRRLLIRAHGEPPEVYAKAERRGFEVVDCTCPVVLKLQKSIRLAWERLMLLPTPGQVVIFGKRGHAEVLGLVGQTGGNAVVVETPEELSEALEAGIIQAGSEVEFFSQTTMSPVKFASACSILRKVFPEEKLSIHDTICARMASRHEKLKSFALSHDVLVFVSGSSSSNGKVLFNLCREVNPDAHCITSVGQIRPEWFLKAESVGVCGATSTPKWLLERVAVTIENLQ